MKHYLMLIVFWFLVTSIFATELLVGAGQEYATIKLAMLSAADGDTITVHDGTYIGGVRVNREVMLRSINGAEHTFVQADTVWVSPFEVYANNVVIDGFSAYGATSRNGIGIYGTSGVVIRNNRCGWAPGYSNQLGIQLYADSYGTLADNVTISGNICSYNEEGGIYINSGNHLVENNICEHNQSPVYPEIAGISAYATHNCTIKGNQCRYNDIGVKYYYNSGFDAVVDNVCSNNEDHGIWAHFQHDMQYARNEIHDNGISGIRISGLWDSWFWANRLSGNTLGLYVRDSSYIGFHLNSFSDITKFEFLNSDEISFRSPTKLCYTYNFTTFKGWMGNYYNDVTGEDLDGDGIDDSTYDLGDYIDTMPLVQHRDQYNLQVWFLQDIMMYRNSEIEIGGLRVMNSDYTSHVWIADGAVVDGISYPAGTFEDQGSWTGQLTRYNSSSEDYTVEIGYWDGSQFVPGGPQCDVNSHYGRVVEHLACSEAAFGIPGGSSLALRLTVNNTILYRFKTGAAFSYITAPIGSPEYIDHDSDLESPVLRISRVASQKFNYIALEWDPVPGASSYNVYSRDMPYGPFTLETTGTTIEVTQWFDFEEGADRKFYKVTAVD